ncbi:hypothetical protein ACOSQ3_018777 [Xanthoceras sorbifolium]
MNTFEWNVRGMKCNRAFRILHRFMRDHSFDIVFLFETISTHAWMEMLRIQLGFAGKLVVKKDGRSGRLCLFWSSKVDESLLYFSKFYIDVKVVSHSDRNWRFTGFYGEPDALNVSNLGLF